MKMVGLIDIKRGDVHAETRKGRNGEWQDRWQDGYCQVGEEVRRIKITLNRDDGGHAPGRYKVEAPLMVNQYGKFETPFVFPLEAVK